MCGMRSVAKSTLETKAKNHSAQSLLRARLWAELKWGL